MRKVKGWGGEKGDGEAEGESEAKMGKTGITFNDVAPR